MTYVESLLARDERLVLVSRDHWIMLLPTVLVDVAVGTVIIGLSAMGFSFLSPWTLLGLLLLTVPAGHLVFRIVMWWNNQVIITDQRIVQVTGMLDKRVSDTLVEKVNHPAASCGASQWDVYYLGGCRPQTPAGHSSPQQAGGHPGRSSE